MGLRRLPYLLMILLLLWGGVDDLVVSTANADPSDDVATSENDDYLAPSLPCRQRQPRDADEGLPGVLLSGTTSVHPAFPSLIRLSRLSCRSFAATDPLYAFMSLQL